MDNPQNLLILLLVGIFCFVIAILFRSNKALDRVGDVERELGVIEDELKEIADTKSHPIASVTEGVPHVSLQNTEAPFPNEEVIHKV